METKDREIARMLSGKGISWNNLTEKKKKEAKRVFDVASGKIEKIKALREEIEQYRFNKNTLAEELGLNRKTIGSNNPEIAALVDLFIQKQKDLIYRTPIEKKSNDKVNALEETIEKLMARDCESVELDNKYRELKKELKAVEGQRDAYLKEKLSIKKEMEELEKKYKKTIAELQDQLNLFKINTNNNNFS